MKFIIDISVFTEDQAVGNICGSIEASLIPQIGDSVDFQCPASVIGLTQTPQFTGILKVRNRVLTVRGNQDIFIVFEDVDVGSFEDGLTMLNYFEEQLKLHSNVY